MLIFPSSATEYGQNIGSRQKDMERRTARRKPLCHRVPERTRDRGRRRDLFGGIERGEEERNFSLCVTSADRKFREFPKDEDEGGERGGRKCSIIK